MTTRTALLHPTAAHAPRIPPIVRPPLPLPLPRADRDGVPWATSLPWTPPETRDYLRANLWAVEMPGAPWVPGGSSQYPERILSWFLDRYAIDFQRAYLTKYAGYGYTHCYLSPPDSIQGFGRTLSQFLETCALVKRYVPYVGIMLGSKVYQPADMTPDAWRAYVDPLLDALLPIADEFSIWEYNLWNRTAPDAITIWRHIGDRCHAQQKSCWLHFSPHVTSWFQDGDPRGRFGFYDDLGASIDGINYQGDSRWTSQDSADRAVDTLWQFGQSGNRHKFRFFEDVAILQFDGGSQTGFPPDYATDDPRGAPVTPDDGDCRGWYLACTTDNAHGTDAKVWGYGNGARRPDGTRL
jgi:hypothetical protein